MGNLALNMNVDFVTVECFSCHVVFAVSEYFNSQKRQNGETFYCPSGHGQVYRDNENTRLRKEKEALERRLEVAKQEARAEMQRRERVEKETRRLKKRVHNGVCPECNRTFPNLRRRTF